MSGFIINEKYEILENVHGDWRIWNLTKNDFVAFGGALLLLDSKQDAIDFLTNEGLL